MLNFLFLVSLVYIIRTIILLIKDIVLLFKYNRIVDNLGENETAEEPEYWSTDNLKKERIIFWISLSYFLYYLFN